MFEQVYQTTPHYLYPSSPDTSSTDKSTTTETSNTRDTADICLFITQPRGNSSLNKPDTQESCPTTTGCLRTGMVGLAPKWARLAQNGTNPGLFRDKMY